jgi:bifunctional NMN adenylyltransferase/nudix hydrolase
MIDKLYDFCIFIGRFQPFHLGHFSLLQEALNKSEKVIVVLGSAVKASNTRNPWCISSRKDMITASLTHDEIDRVLFIEMRDYLYNDNLWLTDLQQKVSEITGDSDKIAIIGNDYDKTSSYLNLFPQWTLLSMKNNDKYPRATELRNMYFTHDSGYKRFIHANNVEFLEKFKETESFKQLKDEFDYLKVYHAKWDGSPFKPTFVTVDSVVIKSGHVLVVRRKGALGKGLIALPGGFLNTDESIQDGAIRELKEETAIKMSKEDLRASITESKVFDHPDRSLRGRTITHTFLLNLKSGVLPKVKGSDDADKAWWMPLSELGSREEEFFEDHYHIISYYVSRF